MARSKVKSRSDHDVAHLHPLTNVPTKYELPTPYSFRDTAQTKIFPSRPPTHPPAHPDTMGENNTPTALKGCGVKISKYGLCGPQKHFFPSRPPTHPPAHPDTMGENNTPTALKAVG